MFGAGRIAGPIVGPTGNKKYELSICGSENVPRIFAYFDSGDFVGIKVRSYILFKELWLLFNKQTHLIPSERPRIEKLCDAVNDAYEVLRLEKTLIEAQSLQDPGAFQNGQGGALGKGRRGRP